MRTTTSRPETSDHRWTGLEPLEPRWLLADIGLGFNTALPVCLANPANALTGYVTDSTADVAVTLTHAGGALVGTWPAITNGSGGWSFTAPDPSALTDGHYDVLLAASANGGLDTGTLSAPDGLIVDTIYPSLAVDAGQLPAVVGADTTLTGTFSDANIDIVFVTLHPGNGGSSKDFAAVVNAGAGTWSAQIPLAGLSDAICSVNATAIDLAGNSTTIAVNGTLTVDTTDPTVAIGSTLPATVKADTTVTGTFSDDNISTVTVTLDNGAGGTHDFPATLNAGAGTWSAAIAIAGLPDAAYTVSAKALDLAGNSATAAGAGALTIDTTAPAVAAYTLATTDKTPPLTGTVSDTTAAVTVTVRGTTYNAVNNGNGTWTLADGTISSLPDGTYRLTVKATDTVGNVTTNTSSFLTVDTTAPKVTVDKLISTSTSPAVTGTVDDRSATVSVVINSVTYTAVNNADGTWTLAAATVPALAQGVYNVTATATDALGNAATETTTKELTIAKAQTITMGTGVSKVTYTDADGTAMIVLAGQGNVAVTFTGVSLAATGTGASRAVTATGGVLKVDVNVAGASTSLIFRAAAKGDALAKVNSISGSGSLGSLLGNQLDLVGGISMTGVIRNMRVHDILSDISMGAWAPGVNILANAVVDCTVHAATFGTFTANTFSGATVTATKIGGLRAKLGFADTNVTADRIGWVVLWNLQADNAGTAFGVKANTKLGSLTVVQGLRLKHNRGHVYLHWGTNFTTGIEDFSVTA